MSQTPGNYLTREQVVNIELNKFINEESGNHQTFDEVLPGYDKTSNNESNLSTPTDSSNFKHAVQPVLNQPDLIEENDQLPYPILTDDPMWSPPMESNPDFDQQFGYKNKNDVPSPDSSLLSFYSSLEQPNPNNEMGWSSQPTYPMQGPQETEYYNQNVYIEQGSPNKPITQQYQDISRESQRKTVNLLEPRTGNDQLPYPILTDDPMWSPPMESSPGFDQQTGYKNGNDFLSPDNSLLSFDSSFEQPNPNNDNLIDYTSEPTYPMQGPQETQYYNDFIKQGSPNKPITQQYQDISRESQGKTVYLLEPRADIANNVQSIREEGNSGFGITYSNQYNQQNTAPLSNNFLANPPDYSQGPQNHCAYYEEPQSWNNNNQNVVSGFAKMDIQSPTDHNSVYHEDNIIKSEQLEPNNQSETIAPKLKRKRATKRQMSEMSEEQKEERKRMGARNNTAEYNKRKKEEKKKLEEELKICNEKITGLKKGCFDCEENIHNCIAFNSQYTYNDPYFYTLQYNFACYLDKHRQSLELIKSNNEVGVLETDFEKAKATFQTAVDNVEQKQANTNTYGSTKSRAKSEMIVAEMKLEIKVIEFEEATFKKHSDILQRFKQDWSLQFRRTIQYNNINLQRIYSMPQNEQEKIDKLLNFFNLPNPT